MALLHRDALLIVAAASPASSRCGLMDNSASCPQALGLTRGPRPLATLKSVPRKRRSLATGRDNKLMHGKLLLYIV